MDWATILNRVFAKAGVEELKASKATKKALKRAAAKQGGQPPDAASLQAFLERGNSGFKLEGKNVVKAPVAQEPVPLAKQQKKEKKQRGAGAAPADVPPAPAPEPAAEKPAKKKHKKHHKQDHDDAQQEQGQEQQKDVQQQAAGEVAGEAAGEKQHKQKQKKRKVAEQQQAEQEGGQQAGADGEPKPAGKKRKSSAGGSGKAAAVDGAGSKGAAAAGGGGIAGGEGGEKWRENYKRANVKSGAFSKQEKDALKQAVHEYAAANNLSTEDMEWLLPKGARDSSHRGMWIKIAAALPHRTIKAVWAAATRMFHPGNYKGSWTAEEDSQLLSLVQERGRKWKEIGGVLERMPETCRDRWLAIRLGEDRRSGKWEEDECERLRQAVGEYLAAKAAAEKQEGGGQGEATVNLADLQGTQQQQQQGEGGGSGGGGGGGGAGSSEGAAAAGVSGRRMVLDDIDWNVVSLAVGTRSNIQCLEKWYSQLSPSMVTRGDWAAGDDRRLLRALYLSGASFDYELDWGQLVRGRTAAQTRRRWRLMLKAVPDSRDKEFAEVVEELVDRYLPALKDQGRQGQQEEATAAE